MKRLLSLFLLITIHKMTFSQVVNIENRRANDGTYGFSGALDLTLSAQQQKDLLVTFHFKPLIQYKFSGKSDRFLRDKDALIERGGKKNDMHTDDSLPDKNKHLILLINDLKYTGARNSTYSNFGMMHLRYAYRIANSAWKWESYAQVQYNQLLLQKIRSLVGSGFRAKILDIGSKEGGFNKRAVRLFGGTSLFYEYEEVNFSDRPIEFNNDVRWSTYISSYLNFKHFEFTSSTYIQPNIAHFSDFRVSGDYTLLFRITDPFSIKINFSHFYDTAPPETVIPHTFSVSAGFVYKLDNFKIDLEKMAANKLKRQEKKIQRIEDKEKDKFEFLPNQPIIEID